jgi:hypothetical protein
MEPTLHVQHRPPGQCVALIAVFNAQDPYGGPITFRLDPNALYETTATRWQTALKI